MFVFFCEGVVYLFDKFNTMYEYQNFGQSPFAPFCPGFRAVLAAFLVEIILQVFDDGRKEVGLARACRHLQHNVHGTIAPLFVYLRLVFPLIVAKHIVVLLLLREMAQLCKIYFSHHGICFSVICRWYCHVKKALNYPFCCSSCLWALELPFWLISSE